RRAGAARSRPCGLEGVALVHVARLEPRTEPAYPLRGRAVGEGFRRHAPSRLLLETVVADGGGGAQARFDVTGIEKIALTRVVPPHSGETIRLQLHAHGERVAARLGGAAALLRHLLRDAELVLDMMPHLVRDHVGTREVAGGAEAPGQVLEERSIEVDFVVGWAVEGSHGGAAHAAGGVDGAAEEHQLRRLMLAPSLPENSAPGVLGVPQDPCDEILGLVARARRGARGRRRTLRRRGGCIASLQRDEDVEGVEAEEPADRQHRDQPDSSELESAAETARRDGFAILHITAAPHASPTHSPSLLFDPGKALQRPSPLYKVPAVAARRRLAVTMATCRSAARACSCSAAAATVCACCSSIRAVRSGRTRTWAPGRFPRGSSTPARKRLPLLRASSGRRRASSRA